MVKGSPICHQVNGFVINTAVGMHTTIIKGHRKQIFLVSMLVEAAGHFVRLVISGRVGHASISHIILAEQPFYRNGVIAGAIRLVNELPPQVGEGFVNGAGLVVII